MEEYDNAFRIARAVTDLAELNSAWRGTTDGKRFSAYELLLSEALLAYHTEVERLNLNLDDSHATIQSIARERDERFQAVVMLMNGLQGLRTKLLDFARAAQDHMTDHDGLELADITMADLGRTIDSLLKVG